MLEVALVTATLVAGPPVVAEPAYKVDVGSLPSKADCRPSILPIIWLCESSLTETLPFASTVISVPDFTPPRAPEVATGRE
jgi:hypothetical protein